MYSLRILTTLGSVLVPRSLLAPLLKRILSSDFTRGLSGSSLTAALTAGLKMSLTQSPKDSERFVSIFPTMAFMALEFSGSPASAF